MTFSSTSTKASAAATAATSLNHNMVTRTDVCLTSIPETMLWTLHNRQLEAAKSNGFITDPQCVNIYQSINYDYERSFGKADGSHALRSLVFDEAIVDFWNDNEETETVVVNLGEGLETQRFRLENHEHERNCVWITVDLPEALKAREQFITPDERHIHVPASALDVDTWARFVPDGRPVLITAQGLFMYFEESQVKTLFQAFAKHFPGSVLIFDAIAKWFSDKTMKPGGFQKTKYYTTPLMPFGVNRHDSPALYKSWVPGLKVEEVDFQFDKLPGIWGFIAPIINVTPIVSNYVPAHISRVTFPNTTGTSAT